MQIYVASHLQAVGRHLVCAAQNLLARGQLFLPAIYSRIVNFQRAAGVNPTPRRCYALQPSKADRRASVRRGASGQKAATTRYDHGGEIEVSRQALKDLPPIGIADDRTMKPPAPVTAATSG